MLCVPLGRAVDRGDSAVGVPSGSRLGSGGAFLTTAAEKRSPGGHLQQELQCPGTTGPWTCVCRAWGHGGGAGDVLLHVHMFRGCSGSVSEDNAKSSRRGRGLGSALGRLDLPKLTCLHPWRVGLSYKEH